MKKILNWVFTLHCLVIFAILAGYIPRTVALYDALALAVFFILLPLEDGLIFFVRTIPLFIALPLTKSYDNLNMWRIFAIVLFLKWFFERQTWHYLISGVILLAKKPAQFIREHTWLASFAGLLILACLSVFVSPDRGAALKKILFFLNAGVIGFLIAYPPRSAEFFKRLIKNITIPVIIVALVGVVQILLTYFIDIYAFMRVWGEGVQLREFGAMWSYIAVNVGNTWFAYFGSQLSLRVFSLFPDSHSFPIFLILGLPAFFAWTLTRPLSQTTLKKMFQTRGRMSVLWIPLIFLMAILSGTRGIWAAGIAMLIWLPIALFILRKLGANKEKRSMLVYLGSYLALFIALFFVAFPIFSSPQFLLQKNDEALLEHRFRSIIDLGETSNAQRIEIWKKSLISIAKHPVLGVGIGNFPVVLNENIELAKAGASAHNIYLHVAAEMGLPALLIFLVLLFLILKDIFWHFVSTRDVFFSAYFGGLLISIPWILSYLMTDVTVFDERALLLATTTLAIVAGYHNHG